MVVNDGPRLCWNFIHSLKVVDLPLRVISLFSKLTKRKVSSLQMAYFHRQDK